MTATVLDNIYVGITLAFQHAHQMELHVALMPTVTEFNIVLFANVHLVSLVTLKSHVRKLLVKLIATVQMIAHVSTRNA